MLSKAEVLYLQGRKQISKSYERKLKCIIRKKLEILREEFPLLSKLFVNEVKPLLYAITLTELLSVKGCNENLDRSNQQFVVHNPFKVNTCSIASFFKIFEFYLRMF